jgi:hypothetical protein
MLHRHRATIQCWLTMVIRIFSLVPFVHNAPAWSRSTNFWIFPVDVLGNGP